VMGKELIQPIDPVSAKAISDAAQFGSKMIDAGTAVGRYTAGVLADLPHDLVGIVGDYVKHKRLRRAIELDRECKKILSDRGVKNPIDPSPSIAIPLLKAAVDEDREVLRDLWTRLLANACDPARTDRVRASFIELLKKLDPFDAQVLQILGTVSGEPAPNPRDYVKGLTKRSEDEVMVSFENLIELGCFSQRTSETWKPLMASRGRLLLAAVSA
jgi:abortive infection alpha-like protein